MEQILEFKCLGCGNKLYSKDAVDGLVECDHCGQKRAVPRMDNSPQALSFLTIGENHLDTGKFNDAYDAYLKASELSPKEPEAFFGMALSQMQVRYIKDEVNNRLQPICYEISSKKFTDNGNYKKALQLATDSQRIEYEQRAKSIDYIQQEFYRLKQSGLDYDCFICVKVTDNGEKTEDSKDAEYIYDLLKRNNYKPFYSEREIRNAQGVDYEARIAYALYASETMLIVCRDETYLQTKWVKNEYTRFLKLQNDGEKECDSITIVFYGTPIERLPGKNGKLQGIDFSKRAADQDIIKFVDEHTVEAKKKKEEEKRRQKASEEKYAKQQKEVEKKLEKLESTYRKQNASITSDTLYERGNIEIRDSNFQGAAEYYNRSLDIDPKNAQSWWGLFLCDFKVANEKELTVHKLNDNDLVALIGELQKNRNFKNSIVNMNDDLNERYDVFVENITNNVNGNMDILKEKVYKNENELKTIQTATETCEEAIRKYGHGKNSKQLKKIQPTARYNELLCFEDFTDWWIFAPLKAHSFLLHAFHHNLIVLTIGFALWLVLLPFVLGITVILLVLVLIFKFFQTIFNRSYNKRTSEERTRFEHDLSQVIENENQIKKLESKKKRLNTEIKNGKNVISFYETFLRLIQNTSFAQNLSMDKFQTPLSSDDDIHTNAESNLYDGEKAKQYRLNLVRADRSKLLVYYTKLAKEQSSWMSLKEAKQQAENFVDAIMKDGGISSEQYSKEDLEGFKNDLERAGAIVEIIG